VFQGTGDPLPIRAVQGPKTRRQCPAERRYAAKGPYDVGVVALNMNDRPLIVWYPAEAGSSAGKDQGRYDMRAFLPADQQSKVAASDATVFKMDAYKDVPAPNDDGPFPLVLFSLLLQLRVGPEQLAVPLSEINLQDLGLLLLVVDLLTLRLYSCDTRNDGQHCDDKNNKTAPDVVLVHVSPPWRQLYSRLRSYRHPRRETQL